MTYAQSVETPQTRQGSRWTNERSRGLMATISRYVLTVSSLYENAFSLANPHAPIHETCEDP